MRKKNKIIVTGGAGFVGTNLIKLLLSKTKHKIISTEVKLLPENEVGLNRHKNHEELRWKVVEDFQNLHSFQNN